MGNGDLKSRLFSHKREALRAREARINTAFGWSTFG